MNRKKKQKNFSVIEGGFFRLPHQVSGSIAYRSLSSHAAKLLIDLGSYFRGNNNGDLSASFKVLKKERGWKSSATLDRAKKELIKYGLIVKTRQGGKNKCCLYGFTFLKTFSSIKGYSKSFSATFHCLKILAKSSTRLSPLLNIH